MAIIEKISLNTNEYSQYVGNVPIEYLEIPSDYALSTIKALVPGFGSYQYLKGLGISTTLRPDDFAPLFNSLPDLETGVNFTYNGNEKALYELSLANGNLALDIRADSGGYLIASVKMNQNHGYNLSGNNFDFGYISSNNVFKAGLVIVKTQSIEFLGCMLLSRNDDNPYLPQFVGVSIEDINKFFGQINFEIKKSDDEYGDFSQGGGYSFPSFDKSSDTIGLPPVPNIGISNIGFINVYNPSINGLANLGEDLFPDVNLTTDSDLSAIAKNVGELAKSFVNSKLIDYVIDTHIIPVTPIASTTENIKIGFKTFNQQAPKVTSDYIDFDCGTLEIAEYYSNFIDYVGTTAKLYLPFVGYTNVEPEYFQNGKLQVIYRFNIIDGSFIAFVISTSSKSNLKESVIATYSGNCCVHIPLTGLNYSSMVSGVVGGALKGLSSISSGNIGGTISSAIEISQAKPQMENSNAYNATSAFLGIRTPYLLISRTVSDFPENYAKEKALPYNVTQKIGELTGLTFIDNIILDNLNITESEKEMLTGLLSKGVYL